MEQILIDSTVLIQFFRNLSQARDYLFESNKRFFVSRIVIMEIVSGTKSRLDAEKAVNQIKEMGIEIIEVNEIISKKAGEIFIMFGHTNGIGMMDAFIAATAIESSLKLVTHNLKHFRFIKDLELVVPY